MDSDVTQSNAENVEWQDITSEFLSCCQQLNLGELIKSDNFTLLDAMTAAELMDPKMDSGMMVRHLKRKILTPDQAIKSGQVKINNLEYNELIGIMDETYSCLTTWFEGHSIVQTLMTNIYLHEPERIQDKCLRVFSLALLKIAHFIDHLVGTANCLEDEDFQFNVSKFSLASQFSDQRVSSMLEDTCQQYEKILSQSESFNGKTSDMKSQEHKSEQDQNISFSNDKSKQDTDEPCKSSSQLIKAIVDRMRFTQGLYSFFHATYHSLILDCPNLDLQSESQLNKTIKQIQNSVLSSDKNLEKCLKYIDKLLETIDLGIKPEKRLSGANDVFNAADYPTIMGFDPLVNHKLFPPAYPRCPSIKPRPAAIEFLRDLIIRLRQCISISTSFNQKSFSKSLNLIENFSKYNKPSSCVISRSYLQLLYLPRKCVKLLKEELAQSMCEFCQPLIQDMRKDVLRSPMFDAFLEESAKSFLQVVYSYGHNPARQQPRISDQISSFKNLQYSSILLDKVYESNIVYSWTTCNLAQLGIKYVLSGLELNLFSPYEFPYVFWYLYDILYRNEREQLVLARQLILDNQYYIDEKTKRKKLRKRDQIDVSSHEMNLNSNTALRFLAGGLFVLSYGLRMQNKIKTPFMNLTSEQICFDRRFGDLTESSVYQSYTQCKDGLGPLVSIYVKALDCFTEGKNLFETLGNNESCLKVCKTNMVVARILLSNLEAIPSRLVEFSFDVHPSFPIVKL